MNGSRTAAICKEHCCLPSGVSSSDDSNILEVVQNGFDRRARVMDSRRYETVRAFSFQLPPAHARCNQYSPGAKKRAAVEMQLVSIFNRLDLFDADRRHHLRSEFEHLKSASCCEVGA